MRLPTKARHSMALTKTEHEARMNSRLIRRMLMIMANPAWSETAGKTRRTVYDTGNSGVRRPE